MRYGTRPAEVGCLLEGDLISEADATKLGAGKTRTRTRRVVGALTGPAGETGRISKELNEAAFP